MEVAVLELYRVCKILFCNPRGRSLLFQNSPVKKYWFKIGMCCCIFGIFCVAASAKTEKPPSNLEELLGHLEKQHSDIKTLAVRFRQEKYFSFMNKPVVSKGFIFFSSPGMIRFDITEPFHTTLMDNGKKIERYDLIDGKWCPARFNGGKSIKLVMDQIGQWMQGKFSQQKNMFVLSMSVEDPNTYISLDLKPRHKQFQRYIEKIRISISAPPAYKISRIDIYEPKGDRFALDFVQEVVNRNLPKDCFSNPQTATLCKELFSREKQDDKPQEDNNQECRSDS